MTLGCLREGQRGNWKGQRDPGLASLWICGRRGQMGKECQVRVPSQMASEAKAVPVLEGATLGVQQRAPKCSQHLLALFEGREGNVSMLVTEGSPCG